MPLCAHDKMVYSVIAIASMSIPRMLQQAVIFKIVSAPRRYTSWRDDGEVCVLLSSQLRNGKWKFGNEISHVFGFDRTFETLSPIMKAWTTKS